MKRTARSNAREVAIPSFDCATRTPVSTSTSLLDNALALIQSMASRWPDEKIAATPEPDGLPSG